MKRYDTDLAALTLVRAALNEDSHTIHATIRTAGEQRRLEGLFIAMLQLSANCVHHTARQRGQDVEEFLDALVMAELTEEDSL